MKRTLTIIPTYDLSKNEIARMDKVVEYFPLHIGDYIISKKEELHPDDLDHPDIAKSYCRESLEGLRSDSFLERKVNMLDLKNRIVFYLTSEPLFEATPYGLAWIMGRVLNFCTPLGIVSTNKVPNYAPTLIHELGHLFGLRHHEDKTCYMISDRIDDKNHPKRFCDPCEKKLNSEGYKVIAKIKGWLNV